MASDYTVHLVKRGEDEKNLSMHWFHSFMPQWPELSELHVGKLSSLSDLRARCAFEESITNYFVELYRILTKYNLKNKPRSF